MKSNKEAILSYDNFKTILEIKYKEAISKINEKNMEISKFDNFQNEISDCIFSKYSKNTLDKINKKFDNNSKTKFIIIMDFNTSQEDSVYDEYSDIYKKGDIVTIITEETKSINKLIQYLNQVGCKIDQVINIGKENKKINYKSNAFLYTISQVFKDFIIGNEVSGIYLVSRSSKYSNFAEKIFPVNKKISAFICNKFSSKINVFFPTQSIWNDNMIDQFIHINIILKVLRIEENNLIIKSMEINDNIELINKKIKELNREDRTNKSLLMSDELNILQGDRNENNKSKK